VSWSIVDLTPWITADSDTYIASDCYGANMRILRSGLIAYTVGGSDLQNAELGILDLIKQAKTVKYKFDTSLGQTHIRLYDRTKGKIVTLAGWGMAGSGAPCGNYGNIYIIDQDGNITVQCMPQTNYYGNVGFCFYDAKTGYIYCGQMHGASGLYKLNPDGSFNDFWQSSQTGGGAYVKQFIPLDENNIIYSSNGGGATQYLGKGTVSYLFESWKSKTYVEDGLTSLTPPGIEVLDWDSAIVGKTYYKTYQQKLYSTTDFQTFNTVLSPSTSSFALAGPYLGRLVIYDESNKQITIYNPASNQVEATLTFTGDKFGTKDLPYFIVVDVTNRQFKVQALAYNGQIPLIQFDPSTNRVRVIDVLTGNALSGFKIKLFYSRLIYPVNYEPARDPDYTLTPSDWTSLPNPPDSTRINANLHLTL
jgi:hypothetical protein